MLFITPYIYFITTFAVALIRNDWIYYAIT
nr:MAG TPA: hypothetical protein [Caudoviricetes sp.]